MRRVITFRELGLCVMLTFGTLATAQPIITGLSTPDSLDHFELGEAGADDYGALPYGQGHMLFLSNRNQNGLTARDPETNEPFARPYLLRLKDIKTLPFELPGILADQKYHIGLCALLPDSSGIIASHSRSKPYKNGTVGLTLSFIPKVHTNYHYLRNF